MHKALVVILASSWFLSIGVLAQSVHTPSPGSAERKAILDAARPRVLTDLGYSGPMLFKVDRLRVAGDWALLWAQAVTPSGAPIYKGCDPVDEITLVLLRRVQGHWGLVRGGVACSGGVFWLSWPEETGAPAVIFQGGG